MEFTGQVQGFKTMANGGARITIDIFDSTPAKDIATLALIGMAQPVVKVNLEEKGDGDGSKEG